MTTATQTENFESREFFHKAKASIQRSNFKRASLLLNEALKIAPSNPMYISFMGYCRAMQGELSEGERMCRMALKISPSIPILLVNLGRVLMEKGERKEAREIFTQAYGIDNTNAAAALELSRMGVRRKPVLPFLERSHPLNIYLGKIRYKFRVRMKQPKWKKL